MQDAERTLDPENLKSSMYVDHLDCSLIHFMARSIILRCDLCALMERDQC
jgi:hypothetical protein